MSDLNFDTWAERVTIDLDEWQSNDHADPDLADELARLLHNGYNLLHAIDQVVAAYSAGAANVGDPDAVVSEVAMILAAPGANS